MKKIKSFISIMLVAVMALAMSMTAFAAEGPQTYTITINNSAEGHIYEAYQIFSGVLDSTEKILSDVEWGSGVTAAGQTEFGDAAVYAKSLEGNEAAAAEFAQGLSNYLGAVAGTSQKDGNVYKISGLAPGYYLVKDKDGSLTNNDNYTTFILEVVADAEATPKNTGVPEPDKGVKDTNDSDGTTDDTYQDSADYDIGDTVPYELKATLPNTVNAYKTYKLVFHDELSAGLDYVADSAVVKVNGKAITSGYVLTYEERKLTISFEDVKSAPVNAGNNDVITVEYNAILNENANVGATGNINTMHLEYSNNPNDGGQGTGTSPDKIAVVFTYKTVVNKVDEDQKPLTGAEFKLEKKLSNGTWSEIDRKTVNQNGDVFTFNGLDDGIYKLTETAVPDGYNSIEPIYFKVTATHSEYEDKTSTGLDSLTVAACDENGTELTGENITKFTVEQSAGEANTNIVNKSGATLPSTGGIGTTIFYIVGAILVIGAGIILVTKKRMSHE